MLSWFVGIVDFNAAIVLIAMFLMVGIPLGMFVAKYRSKDDLKGQYEVTKLKVHTEESARLYQLETERSVKIEQVQGEREQKLKQIEQGLITSHRETGRGGD